MYCLIVLNLTHQNQEFFPLILLEIISKFEDVTD